MKWPPLPAPDIPPAIKCCITCKNGRSNTRFFRGAKITAARWSRTHPSVNRPPYSMRAHRKDGFCMRSLWRMTRAPGKSRFDSCCATPTCSSSQGIQRRPHCRQRRRLRSRVSEAEMARIDAAFPRGTRRAPADDLGRHAQNVRPHRTHRRSAGQCQSHAQFVAHDFHRLGHARFTARRQGIQERLADQCTPSPKSQRFGDVLAERMPPSNSTSQRPSMAAAISGNTAIEDGAPSSCRPP